MSKTFFQFSSVNLIEILSKVMPALFIMILGIKFNSLSFSGRFLTLSLDVISNWIDNILADVFSGLKVNFDLAVPITS